LPAYVFVGVRISFLIIKRFPSAEKLRAKSGKTVLGCAAAGHSNICEVRATSIGAIFAAQVLPDLQRKGLCGKEASLLT
jgi:hypothetical protein